MTRLKVVIPYAIGLLIITFGLLALFNILSNSKERNTETWILNHLDQIFTYSEESHILSIELYETDVETFLYIRYQQNPLEESIKTVIATQKSEKTVTQVTEPLFPDVMSQFEDAKLDYIEHIIYSQTEIESFLSELR
jgi:hypothetical protein